MLFDCCQRVGFFTERQLMDQAGEESEIERHAAGWSRLFLGFPGLVQCDGSFVGAGIGFEGCSK